MNEARRGKGKSTASWVYAHLFNSLNLHTHVYSSTVLKGLLRSNLTRLANIFQETFTFAGIVNLLHSLQGKLESLLLVVFFLGYLFGGWCHNDFLGGEKKYY